jgi:hypothetical protein
MTRADRIEVALIALVTTLTAVTVTSWASLPRHIELGEALLAGAAGLLFQGLVRDIGRWRRMQPPRHAPLDERGLDVVAPRRITCACLESTLGLGAITAGAVLLFAWTPVVLHPVRAAWPIGVGLVGTFGFLTREVVLDWKQLRIRRETDHGAAVTWRG